MARQRGGLRAKPVPGRPRRMSDQQLRKLRTLLRQGAVAHGWSSQKPQKHARERNDQEVERWIAEDWPRVLHQAVQRRAHIALLDESGFLLAPLVRRTLAPRDETPIVDCWERHDRISVASAITVSPRALRVGLHFMLLGAGHAGIDTTERFYLAIRKDVVDRARAASEASRKGHSVARLLRAPNESDEIEEPPCVSALSAKI